jgi:hypothetical protein
MTRLVSVQGSNTSNVNGEVVRWNHDRGVDTLDAKTYIEMLEREVEILRQELADNAEVPFHLTPSAPKFSLCLAFGQWNSCGPCVSASCA